MDKRWLLLLLAPLFVPLAIWTIDQSRVSVWVGRTALLTEFAVSDAASGAPVRGALVEVEKFIGIRDELSRREFQLQTASDGWASHVSSGVTSYGRSGRLGIQDTYQIAMPFWRARASAPGFEPSDWIELDSPEYRAKVHRLAPGHCRLRGEIRLRRLRN